MPAWYNCWAALALEIFGVVFWLPAFASLGAWSSINSLYSSYYQSDCHYYGTCNYQTAWQTAAAAAGMGGLEFILFLVTLITFSVFLHRHRTQGAPTHFGMQPSYGGGHPAPAGGQQPVDMQNMGYPPKEPATTYTQPAAYAQQQQPVYTS
ncbi:MAG: hypothetical protein M1839_008919 [Geoglossum umbratile]|nr:MAG: hypothetical protein M1839_008919 [Geoglossum umbratile]